LARAAGQEDLPSGQLISEVDALFAAARDGDNAANEVLLRVGARLGAGLASLVNLTDPDCIVLGGTLGRLLGLQPTPIVESVAQRSFLDRAGAIPIRPGALKDAAVLGAAELAFQPLLADPRAALLATH
jgi:predicted NBD/HSP70 family sugar kinase